MRRERSSMNPTRSANRMNREFRLTNSTDIRRVRRKGTSYAHPLVILIAAPNQQSTNRFGIIAGRAVGNAVNRNRAKRRLRAAIRHLLPRFHPGWDAVLIARSGVAHAAWGDLLSAIEGLSKQAGVLRDK